MVMTPEFWQASRLAAQMSYAKINLVLSVMRSDYILVLRFGVHSSDEHE